MWGLRCYLLFSAQGRRIIWQQGARRKEKPIVASTKDKHTTSVLPNSATLLFLLAVQIMKTVWRESKKKNMMINDKEAPRGKAMACIVSITCAWATRRFKRNKAHWFKSKHSLGSFGVVSERNLCDAEDSLDLSWSSALRIESNSDRTPKSMRIFPYRKLP